MLLDADIAANPSSTGSPPPIFNSAEFHSVTFSHGFSSPPEAGKVAAVDTTKASFPKLCRDPHCQCYEADEIARPGIGARMSEIDGDSLRAAHDDCRVAAVDVQQTARNEAAVGDRSPRELL